EVQTKAEFFRIGTQTSRRIAADVEAVNTDVNAAEGTGIVERDFDHFFDRSVVRVEANAVRVRTVIGRFRRKGEAELEAGKARGEVGHLVRVSSHQREGRVAEAEIGRVVHVQD